MYLNILILPFLGFFSAILFGRFIGIFGCCIITTTSIIITFFLSLYAFFEITLSGSNCIIFVADWINCESFTANWGFFFDPLTVIMLIVVTGVSSLVHLYSIEYMKGDPHHGRFMSYLSLFTAFMLILVSADNFIVMFFGWEGIGLASFLLISFWHTRIQASKSAIKAMLVNRIGDVGLALGICLIFLNYKTVDYNTVFALTPMVLDKTCYIFGTQVNILVIISLLLFWGVLGKSAQILLHIWLPDAMEGPTPVSALIHAATLVVSGVFLIIRCSIIFENSETTLLIVSVFGSLTAFFAATVGLYQNDLKRVIAYSTCSQLGYMVFASGLSSYSVSMFHLANHAVFKALLFLSAGCIIHGLSDEQDLRKMGGIIKIFPVSYVMILIGSLALIGFPFLTGFYSKDCILELALSKYSIIGNFCYYLGCSAAFCTAFYSFRLVFLTFVNKTNTFKVYIEHAHDAPILMVIPLMVLGLGAIFYGFFSRDLVIGLGSNPFFNATNTLSYNFNLIDAEFLPVILKHIPLIFTVSGILLSLFLINCLGVCKNTVFLLKNNYFKNFYVFLNKKWHFDQIFNELLVIKIMNFGYKVSFLSLDKGFIENFGPVGLSKIALKSSNNLTFFSRNFLYQTTFFLLIGVLFFLSYFFCSNFSLLINLNLNFLFFSYFIFSLLIV